MDPAQQKLLSHEEHRRMMSTLFAVVCIAIILGVIYYWPTMSRMEEQQPVLSSQQQIDEAHVAAALKASGPASEAQIDAVAKSLAKVPAPAQTDQENVARALDK